MTAELLQAVLADPDDDAPRLAYADWCDGNGDPRGRFIRLQIERANAATQARSNELWREIKDLFEEHGAAWTRDIDAVLAGCKYAKLTESSFKRGFVHSLLMNVDEFARNASALMRLAPIERLWTSYGPNDITVLVDLPEATRMRELTSRDEGITDDDVAALAESRYLTNLRLLNLTGNPLGPGAARAIAGSAGFANLRELDLGKTQIGTGGATAIAESRHITGLEILHLRGASIDAAGIRALAGSPNMRSVRMLYLNSFEDTWARKHYDNEIGDEGAEALASSVNLTSLERLEIAKCKIGDAGAAALAASSGLSTLVTLRLSENYIGKDGAAGLAASKTLTKLRTLDLQENVIGEEGTKALAARTGLPALEHLTVSHNGVMTDEYEEWTDWDGTVVGGGPRPARIDEIRHQFFKGQKLEVD